MTVANVWAVIGAEGLKGTFSTMRDGIQAATAANNGDSYKVMLSEKGLKNIQFNHTERTYVIKRTTEADALMYLKYDQCGYADFSHELGTAKEDIFSYLSDMAEHTRSLIYDTGFTLLTDTIRAIVDVLTMVNRGNAAADMVQISAAFVALAEGRRELARRVELQKEEDRRREAERQEAERIEREREQKKNDLLASISASGSNGFKINSSAVLASHVVTEEKDRALISRQLSKAPLFGDISVNQIYKKRAPIMYDLTGGAEVLEAKAVEMSDFLDRFNRAIRTEINELYYKLPWSAYSELSTLWNDIPFIMKGLTENKIDSYYMEAHSIRSPKFSKHLIKTFGEKAVCVRLFNDRPRPEELEKTAAVSIEGKKLVVSNLAANVMKMTADNDFSSCQDYTYDDEDSLEHLQKLPSSTHDETMSIAYIVDESEDFEAPRMLARVLIMPHVYHGQLFYVGVNVYGEGGNDDLLISSMKNLYGDRFLFANELYSNGGTYKHNYKHDYNYVLKVHFTYGESECDCYLCEGNGNVTATVKWHGYEFRTECPHCEGTGIDEDSGRDNDYGGNPYMNDNSTCSYYGNTKTTKVSETVLVDILTAEAEKDGGQADSMTA